MEKVRTHPRVQPLVDGPTPDEDVAAEAAIIVSDGRWMARRHSVTRRADPLVPPPWWEMESRRRLAKFRMERVWMRVDAGLFDAPVGGRNDVLFGLRLDAPDDAVEGRAPYTPLSSFTEIAR